MDLAGQVECVVAWDRGCNRRFVVAADSQTRVLVELVHEGQGGRLLAADTHDDLEIPVGNIGHGRPRSVLDDNLDRIDLTDVRRLDDPAESHAVPAEVFQDVGLRDAGDGDGEHGCPGHGKGESENSYPGHRVSPPVDSWPRAAADGGADGSAHDRPSGATATRVRDCGPRRRQAVAAPVRRTGEGRSKRGDARSLAHGDASARGRRRSARSGRRGASGTALPRVP